MQLIGVQFLLLCNQVVVVSLQAVIACTEVSNLCSMGQLNTFHLHNHRYNEHTSNGPLSGTTRYQKGKTNRDFTEARNSEWQWHQLGHMQVSTSLQTENHASTPPLSFLQAGCSS